MHVRGLLSLLTGRGGVKRSDVGDIHLHHAESHVGIADTAVDGFLARLKGDGRLSDDITVQEIDSPVVPEGREKKKHDRKKSFQPGRKPRGAGKWHPDDKADRPKRSGPKKERSWQDDSRPSGPKKSGPRHADKTGSGPKTSGPKRPGPKSSGPKPSGPKKSSLKQPEANRSDQTLSIRKKPGKSGRPQRPGKPKQGGFKPVRRKSSR